MNNKILISLSSIGTQQAAYTEDTAAAVKQLLEYVDTYHDDGITYQASDMTLVDHSDASYLNESNTCSQSGAHIFISEDNHVPKLNGPILTIA